ncbi:putative holin-like toxin [[Clostridium] colinum]
MNIKDTLELLFIGGMFLLTLLTYIKK